MLPVVVLAGGCAEQPFDVKDTKPGWIESGVREFIDGVVDGQLVVTRPEEPEVDNGPAPLVIERRDRNGEVLSSRTDFTLDGLVRRRHFVRPGAVDTDDELGVTHVLTLRQTPGVVGVGNAQIEVGGVPDEGESTSGLVLTRDSREEAARVELVEPSINVGVAFFPDGSFATATATNATCRVTVRRHDARGDVVRTTTLTDLCHDGVADPQLYPLPDGGVVVQLTSRHLFATVPTAGGSVDIEDPPTGAWDAYLIALDARDELSWIRALATDDVAVEREDQLYLGAPRADGNLLLCGNLPSFSWVALPADVVLARHDDERRSTGVFLEVTPGGDLVRVARTGPEAGHELNYCAVEADGTAWGVDSDFVLWRLDEGSTAPARLPMVDGLFVSPTGFVVTDESVVVSGVAAEAARVPLLGDEIRREDPFLLSLDRAVLKPAP
jgi:hypothetical protein